MEWFRSYHGAPSDPKWLVVARKAKTSPAVVVAMFWTLLDYASQNSPRGSIEGFDTEVTAAFLGVDDEEVKSILSALEDRGMIYENTIASWEKRQAKRDDSRERVRRYRQTKSTSVTDGVTECNADVTECNADVTDVTECNGSVTAKKVQIDREIDREIDTPLPPLGESNPILSESQLADTDSFSGVYVRPSKPERLSKGLSTVSDLTPLYLAYRLGLNGTPLDSPVTPSQVKRNAKALQEMLDAGYTQEQISTTTAKIKAAWGEGFTVTPASVVEHWDKHCSPPPSKATISPRCAAPPSSSVSADTLRALDIEDEETARFYLLRARRRLEEEGTITTFDAKVHKQLVVERAKQMIDKEYRK